MEGVFNADGGAEPQPDVTATASTTNCPTCGTHGDGEGHSAMSTAPVASSTSTSPIEDGLPIPREDLELIVNVLLVIVLLMEVRNAR